MGSGEGPDTVLGGGRLEKTKNGKNNFLEMFGKTGSPKLGKGKTAPTMGGQRGGKREQWGALSWRK